MTAPKPPSAECVQVLAEYADLMAAFGANSPEAKAFHEKHRNLESFEYNAQQLYQLQAEDDEADSVRFKKT